MAKDRFASSLWRPCRLTCTWLARLMTCLMVPSMRRAMLALLYCCGSCRTAQQRAGSQQLACVLHSSNVHQLALTQGKAHHYVNGTLHCAARACQRAQLYFRHAEFPLLNHTDGKLLNTHDYAIRSHDSHLHECDHSVPVIDACKHLVAGHHAQDDCLCLLWP